jgi:hypothetical protein
MARSHDTLPVSAAIEVMPALCAAFAVQDGLASTAAAVALPGPSHTWSWGGDTTQAVNMAAAAAVDIKAAAKCRFLFQAIVALCASSPNVVTAAAECGAAEVTATILRSPGRGSYSQALWLLSEVRRCTLAR